MRRVRRCEVEVAFDELQVRGNGSQEVVGRCISQVPETQDLTNLVGSKEFAELGGGEVRSVVWTRGSEIVCLEIERGRGRVPWLGVPRTHCQLVIEKPCLL